MKLRGSSCAAVLALVLVTTACQGGSAPKTQEKAPESSAVDVNKMPRDKLQDGGVLTQAIAAMPATFNTNHAQGADADLAAIMGPLLPGPFIVDAKVEFQVNHDYYDSIELKSSDPKQVVVYKINPKAYWYDGAPITWKDHEAEWKVNRGTDPAFPIRGSQGWEDVESVERGENDREVVVTFKKKYADWQALFSGMYPASTNATPEAFNEAWRAQPINSAGPFKFESLDPTTQTVTLVRNEKWWGRPAKLDKLVFRTIAPNAQIDALVAGEIDTLDIGPDTNKFKRAQETEGIDLRSAGGPNFRHVTIQGTSPFLSDLKVRRAVALGINRTAIAKAALAPLGLEPVTLGNHIFMRNQVASYEDNSGEFEKQDVDKAAQLLDEAGWKLEGGVRKKNGQELKLRFVIPTGVATSTQESQLIQNQLKPLGIVIDIQTVPTADFFPEYIQKGNFDLTVFSWIGTPFPLSSSKGNYVNPKQGPDGLIIQQNYARIGSQEIDDLYAEGTQQFDQKEKAEIGNKIDALLWQEVHSLALYQRPEIVAVKENLANIGASGFASQPIEDVGYVKEGA